MQTHTYTCTFMYTSWEGLSSSVNGNRAQPADRLASFDPQGALTYPRPSVQEAGRAAAWTPGSPRVLQLHAAPRSCLWSPLPAHHQHVTAGTHPPRQDSQAGEVYKKPPSRPWTSQLYDKMGSPDRVGPYSLADIPCLSELFWV